MASQGSRVAQLLAIEFGFVLVGVPFEGLRNSSIGIVGIVITVNESLQRGRSGQLCRIKTSCLRADVCVELKPGEVGLVEVGGDDAVSSSPFIENEQVPGGESTT